MEIVEQALAFEKETMSNMSTSDRVASSRKAKSLILGLNEIYKETKDETLMDLMKRLTEKKKKIEKRLKMVKI
jgi:seryl-tRNA synthetase